jgi:hypothetical protein
MTFDETQLFGGQGFDWNRPAPSRSSLPGHCTYSSRGPFPAFVFTARFHPFRFHINRAFPVRVVTGIFFLTGYLQIRFLMTVSL